MAVVREDVVRLGFEYDSRAFDRANDSVDDLLDGVKEVGGKNGTGKAEDGFEDAARAAKKFGGTDLSKLSDGLDKIVSSTGKFALAAGKTLAKGLAAGVAVGAAGLAALGTQAIKSYAEYEQLIGGVDTLFKDSSKMVLENANDAFKTAGLSANEYMSTVTSFSASLIQSLGGDTKKAASLADQAIVDMSDNANKMGTDMGMIQNAYQGFAKQNYTMLDNLKLGYGGTKEEMQRLLKDAEKLTGKKYDISNFGDITEAIHAIQVEMGIAGTTAKEASDTIQGSALAMKSAWMNFIGGMANEDADFDQLLDNLIESVITFSNNLIPRIKKMLPRLVRGLTEIAKVIGKELPGILKSILPSLIDGGISLVKSLGSTLVDNMGTFRDIGLSIARMIYKGITGKEMPVEMFANLKVKLYEISVAANKIINGFIDFGKKLWDAVGPALLLIANIAIDSFVWIGDNINWILPVLGSLLGALLAFKAVSKATAALKGFMGLFGKKGAAAGAGGEGGGLMGGSGGIFSMKPGQVLKGLANIGIIVLGLGALAALVMWAAPYMAELTDAGSLGEVIAAIAAVGVVGGLLTKLAGSVGAIPVSVVSKGLANIAIVMLGMGALTAVIMWAAPYIAELSDMNTTFKVLLMITAVGLVGSALAGLAGLIGAIPIAVVLSGLVNIAAALAGFTAIVEAFGLLSQIPGFSEFLSKGGEVLAEICRIIGEMAGSIIGGIGEGVTNSLPAIGENLSSFATSIQPMFDTFAGVDSAGLKDFSLALAALIGVIAGEKLVSVITGGINYGELGSNLNTLATHLSGFFGTIMAFPDGGFEKATALFDCLAGIKGLPKEGGIVGWFEGEVDYAKMATGLGYLSGEGVKSFFAMVASLDDTAFANATKLFDCLAGIKGLPQDGGVVGWFMGEVNFEKIASGLQALASEGMVSALTTIASIPAEGFTALTNLFNALAGITALPKDGGIFDWFTGTETESLTAVAGALPGVATNIASFFKNIGDRTDFSPIKNLFDTLGNIDIDADAASKGFLGLGTSDFEKMGSGLSSFATNAATFFTTVKEVSPEMMSSFFDALGKAGDLPAKLEEANGTMGTTLVTMIENVRLSLQTMKTTIETQLAACATAISDKMDAFYMAGVDLMNGLNLGIQSMRSTLMSTARGIASSIKKTIDEAMDIHSPSRVTFESGSFIGLGLAKGMQSTVPEIKTASAEMSYASIPYIGSYSPESDAAVYNSGGNSEYTTISPSFNLTISGTQDDRATARKVKRYVAEAIKETFESLERKTYAIREV